MNIISEKPILFNSEMVRALIDGRKTQTRRPVKPQPDDDGLAFHIKDNAWSDTSGKIYKNPLGEPGCLLWVREKFCFEPYDGTTVPYESTIRENIGIEGIKWKPSIHMPRWASRITLKVARVTVHRLQDITGRDIMAEGVDNGISNPTMNARWENMQRMAFKDLWDSIYGQDFPLISNPWVYACEFEVIKKNIDKV